MLFKLIFILLLLTLSTFAKDFLKMRKRINYEMSPSGGMAYAPKSKFPPRKMIEKPRQRSHKGFIFLNNKIFLVKTNHRYQIKY